ncbi:MAG: flippase-like domain-containing protein [Candidatus Bathyarchaeota archaeon]|nr:MAG: flippase-like domain-containing protein [Candidatus Bathyarchaeota archaeon]
MKMNERRKVLLRTVPFLLIGLLVFALYLVVFVNISEMINIIQQVNMIVYPFAALALILEAFLFTLNWQYLLLPLSVKVPLRKTFAYVWIGVFADLLIPAESVSGEIAKTYLMSKEPNADPGKVVASLVSQRILGTITTAATLSIGFMGLLILDYPVSGLMLQILVTITGISVLAFGFLVLLCLKEKWTERLVNAIMRFLERVSRGRFKLETIQTRIVDSLRTFYESLRTFGSKPAKLVLPVLFYVLAWFSSITIIILVFIAIGYVEPSMPILFLQVVIVYTLLVAIKSIPLGVPAEVGLPDIFLTTSFILFGIPPDIAAAATVLTRIITVLLRFSIGFIAVQWLGVTSLMGSGGLIEKKNEV